MIKNRKTSMRAIAAALTLAAAGAAGLWTWAAVAQTGAALGPFTDAQAQAGKSVYDGKCAVCHDAGGETIKLVGPGFTDRWRSRGTKDLYTRIKTTMPANDPGNINIRQTADVIAYMLSFNKFPAGGAVLPGDAQILGQIGIVSEKPAEK